MVFGNFKSKHTVVTLLFVLTCVQATCAAEHFSEHLVVRPLNPGYVQLTFAFIDTGELSQHHTTFPPSIAGILNTYPLEHFSLTLTRGRWDSSWGAAGSATATGAILSATWQPHVTPTQVPTLWTGLTNAVSGLFCASLNLLADMSTTASPSVRLPWAGGPFLASDLDHSTVVSAAARTEHTVGMVSQEAVCTENLTAWLKLLPCKDDSGFAAMLRRKAVFGCPYHSFKVEASLSDSGEVTLRQQITLVLSVKPGTSLSEWLGTQSITACPVATSSTLTILQPNASPPVTALHLKISEHTFGERCHAPSASCPHSNGQCEALDDAPSPVTVCELRGLVNAPIDMQLMAAESPWMLGRTDNVHVSQHVLGGGDQYATWQLQIERPNYAADTHQTDLASTTFAWHTRKPDPLRVCTLTIVPWYLQLWLHTLTIIVDGQSVSWNQVVEWQEVRPGEARSAMHVLEICMHMPASVSQIAVHIAIGKTLLYVHEYPPDPHRGFDLSGTRVIALPVHDEKQHVHTDWRESADCQSWVNALTPASFLALGPDANWLMGIVCGPSVVQYTNKNLVSMATPDFSMPYNVCCLTSTLVAVFSVVVVNFLSGRPRAQALFEASKSMQRRKKMLQIALVLVFGVLAVYLDDGLETWVVQNLNHFGVDIERLF